MSEQVVALLMTGSRLRRMWRHLHCLPVLVTSEIVPYNFYNNSNVDKIFINLSHLYICSFRLYISVHPFSELQTPKQKY